MHEAYACVMTKPETRIDYGRRVARVTDHIAENLDAALDIERLAAVANFSPFHFHRIYREATGETAADTVRRLRLHRAAVELLRDDAPLERVAKRAGYGTLAAFSRAFSSDYGVPPGTYRLRGRLLPPPPKRAVESGETYEVDIAPFKGAHLAALTHRGDYQEIGNAFEKVYAWATARNLIGLNTRSIGIYYHDPLSTPPSELRSDAGLVVSAKTQLDGEFHAVEIPPLLCASVLHKGPYAELEKPYRHLFRNWLPQSGRDPADYPCFEEYLNNPRELPASEWLTRVHLPLLP
jgi:AraC family transcriptional regulator